MIDLHCHVLPGFDDGADDWKMAVQMCRQAQRDGVRGLVATPHFFRGLFPTPSVQAVYEATIELGVLCERSLIRDLRIYLGADCHLHPEVIASVRNGKVPTVNSSRYLLLEIPEGPLLPRIKDLLFEIQVAGITPILTHPERNPAFSQHPTALYELLCGGAYAQVTAGSLTGMFGSGTRRAAELMVANGLVQIIASDGHDPERRPPLLSEAVDAARALVGDELAGKMVDDVPRAVLENQPIRFPEPVRPERSKKALWRRVFGI